MNIKRILSQALILLCGSIFCLSAYAQKTSDDVGKYVTQTNFTGSYSGAVNTLQAFYYDETTGQLRHAWTSGPSWNYEWLDGDGINTNDNVGEYASACTYLGSYGGAINTIQLFYYDSSAKALRHAWYDGSWHFEFIDGTGSSYSGATTDDVGQYVKAVTFYYGGSTPVIEVLYYDATTHQLRQASYNGSWVLHGVMDSTTDDVGQYLALTDYTINGTYSLEALYYDNTIHALRQAWTTGSSWSFQWVDGGGYHSDYDDVGKGIAMTQYSNALEAIYYDATIGALKHVWTTGPSWSYETVDHNVSYNVGQFPAITGFGSYLEGFYYDATSLSIKQAVTNGPPFSLSWLDGTGSTHPGYTTDDVGQYASANAYQPTGGSLTLEVLYYDNSVHALRHAWSTGGAWSFEWADGP